VSVCLAGFLIPASAQTSGDDGGSPMPPPSGAPPGAPGMPDSGAADQTAPGQSPSLPAGAIRFVQPNRAAQATSSQNLTQTTAMQTPSAFMPPNDSGGASNPDQLRLNFDNVPLDMILNYLSDAAGFIIVMNTQVHGNVSVISSHPMTRDEAVDLLNAVLNQNGYAAVRNGRTLTIMEKSAAKNSDIPVQIGSNPAEIPRNDEIVTQIIPIRYVDATQLVSDLSSFVSPEATIVANQAGNSIVITDTQQNIHHLVEIISAIDQSAAGETEIQVFALKYANPNDVASELGEIFPSGNPTGPGNSPIRFGGFPGGGFGGGGFGGGGGFFGRMMAAASANGGGNNNRAQKQSQVTAVADARTQSVIVMASKDLMYEIAGMMQSLDVPSQRDQGVYSFSLHNADPQEVAQVLQNMFQSSGSGRGSGQSSSQQQETSPFMNREAQNATTVSTTSSTISSSSANSNGRVGGGGGGGVP
jgi:type II secretory pathway component GspD/PulD (secretin)